MPEESPNTFDEIKPFIRMLEGSIDAARARRLAQEGRPSADNASGRPGPPTSSNPSGPKPTGSVGSETDDRSAESSGGQMASRIRFGQAEAKGSSAVPRVDQRGATLATPNYRH